MHLIAKSALPSNEKELRAPLTAESVANSENSFNTPSLQADLLPVGDLFNLRSDLTVDVLQRDRVNACQLYLIEGY